MKETRVVNGRTYTFNEREQVWIDDKGLDFSSYELRMREEAGKDEVICDDWDDIPDDPNLKWVEDED